VTKRLLLLRHAKAEAGDGRASDHGRALNERGRRDAPRMGIRMQHQGYLPDVVLCSTARRTVETWNRVAAELGGTAELKLLDALYLATEGVILGAIRQLPDSASTTLVIGHNPGLCDAARWLARAPQAGTERAFLRTISEKFPTAALAVLDFEADGWRTLEPHSGTLVDFVRPKDLSDD
jgi:phosphohistidine phosphatase